MPCGRRRGGRLGAGRGARRALAGAWRLGQARHRRPAGRALHRALGRGGVGLVLLLGGQLDRAVHAGVVDGYGSRSRSSVASAEGSGRSRTFPRWLVEVSLDLESRHLLRSAADGRVGHVAALQPHLGPERVELALVAALERCPLERRDRDLVLVGLRSSSTFWARIRANRVSMRVVGLAELRGVLRRQRADPAEVVLHRELAAGVLHDRLVRLPALVRRLGRRAHAAGAPANTSILLARARLSM